MFGAVGWVAKESRKDKPININRIIAEMCVRVSALRVLCLAPWAGVPRSLERINQLT